MLYDFVHILFAPISATIYTLTQYSIIKPLKNMT